VPGADPEQDAAALWARIEARHRAAEEAQARHARATRALEALASSIETRRARQADIAGRIAGMGARYGVEGPEALRAALARGRRLAEGRAALDAGLRELCETLDAADPEAAFAALEGLDRDALTAEAEGLDATLAAHDEALQRRFAERAEAIRALEAVGGDDAVARLDEARATLLIRTGDEAEAHLRRSLGILAVEEALRSYRDSHRSAMLARASAAFSRVSEGAYTGLAAQPEGRREILVALPAEGGSRRAGDLSKGTRFQLYLALRVAGYHEIAAARPPVPFLADDIMETFDDARAAEAFALLAEMAQVGQVIYLTHHRHLCEIARTVCPAARHHSLS